MIKTIIKILIIVLIYLNINNVSAEYMRNIDDDMRIYNIDEKLKTYIEKSKNPEFTKERLIKKIENILWKTKKEIYNIYLWKNNKYNTFKEYALVKIYKYLTFWDIFSGVNNNSSFAKVLENDYIKIIVSDTNFTLNNNKLFWTRKDWLIFNKMEFFKIKPEEKTEDYLINNFLNKNWKIWCELIKIENYFDKKESFYFWLNKKYQSKEIYPWSKICPSKFTKWYYSDWLNYFKRISSTTLIYINQGQDYTWVDFSSMEIK